MNNPILHLLGLAKRAGKLEIGEEPVGAVARAKQAKLILLASDISPNTSRRAATFGQAGNVLHLVLPFSKEELGMALGRNSVAMIALTDAGFAGAVGDKLATLDENKYGAASKQLRAKADKTLARQREKRQHEKNLQRGKGKPWAVPPQVQAEKKKNLEKAALKKDGKQHSSKTKSQKYDDVHCTDKPDSTRAEREMSSRNRENARNYQSKKGMPGSYRSYSPGRDEEKSFGKPGRSSYKGKNYKKRSDSHGTDENSRHKAAGQSLHRSRSESSTKKSYPKFSAGKKLVVTRKTGRSDQS